jgi:arabinofuranan 3-O-arabinosyltransferase
VTATALAAASFIAFGAASWHAFLAWMPVTSTVVFAEGGAGLNKLQSLFGLVRWLGGSMVTAGLLQALLAVSLAAALIWLFRQPLRYEIKAGALALASLLATAYLYIYDFPVLAVPLGFLMRLGLREGFLAYEVAGFVVAAMLVFIFPLLSMPTGFAAAVILAVLIMRRVHVELAPHFAAKQSAVPA